MQYTQLGSSGLSVSEICLGTMTWGIQNTQQDADEQMAIALDVGINFIDTAELYPVPPDAETYGDTERVIGDWLSRNPEKRDDLIIMTKVAGPGLPYIRNATPISGASLSKALDDSLVRLQSDYIDVYQLHWPNRTTPHFAKHWPGQVNPTATNVEQEVAGMRDILTGIKAALDSGKIRHWGLSDDTPWGIQTYLNLCNEMGIPKPVSIQNEFNLLHTKDWPYVIESCVFEDIAYLPWSPLATGILSGKYLNGQLPEGSRWTIAQRMGLFRDTPQTHAATQKYVDLAHSVGITPSQLALAWCKQVPGVTSSIIGATKTSQLRENIAAFDVELSEETLSAISGILQQHPATY